MVKSYGTADFFFKKLNLCVYKGHQTISDFYAEKQLFFPNQKKLYTKRTTNLNSEFK